jgi:hypothetical protein
MTKLTVLYDNISLSNMLWPFLCSMIWDERCCCLFYWYWWKCWSSLFKLSYHNTYEISAYHHLCCEFESRSGLGVQHYVIKFVSNLQQVGGFLRFLRFHAPIKLTATIYNWNIVESCTKHHKTKSNHNDWLHVKTLPLLLFINILEQTWELLFP